MSWKCKKSQVSLEYMVAAGFIVVVITITSILVWQSGILRPPTGEKGKIGFANIDVEDWAVYAEPKSTVAVRLVNVGSDSLKVKKIELKINDVVCSNNISSILIPGKRIIKLLNCSKDLSKEYVVGDFYSANLNITYRNMRVNINGTSEGKIWGVVDKGNVSEIIPPVLFNLRCRYTNKSTGGCSSLGGGGWVCLFSIGSSSNKAYGDHIGECSNPNFDRVLCCKSTDPNYDLSCGDGECIIRVGDNFYGDSGDHVSDCGLTYFSNMIKCSVGIDAYIDCNIKDSCSDDETCLVSVGDHYNTEFGDHVGECNTSLPSFNKKLCCKVL